MLPPKLVLLLTKIFQNTCAKETRCLLYLRDTWSHVVRATIQQYIYIYIYIYIYLGGALGVIFTAVENGHCDSISNPGQSCWHFTLSLYLWERHESTNLLVWAQSFFFSLIHCLTIATDPKMTDCFPIAGGKRDGFMPFLLYMKCNTLLLIRFKFSSPIPSFPTIKITITNRRTSYGVI